MGERYNCEIRRDIWIERFIGMLRSAYDRGEIFSVLVGQELREHLASLVRRLESSIACYEIGSAAELRRLKDWLGESLPSDWERLRFDRLMQDSGE